MKALCYYIPTPYQLGRLPVVTYPVGPWTGLAGLKATEKPCSWFACTPRPFYSVTRLLGQEQSQLTAIGAIGDVGAWAHTVAIVTEIKYGLAIV